MNHVTEVPATFIEDIFAEDVPAGAFAFDRTVAQSIVYSCPCGCGQTVALPIRGESDTTNRRAWGWNGDTVKPTLTPSIKRMDGCRWHGHLQNGVWTPCVDSGQ